MSASRQISLLLILQIRGGASAPELADELQVSVRTIYRDVERLHDAGVPVYAEPGNGGGIRIVDGYRTRLTGLDGSESEALALAGWTTIAEALGLGSAAAGAQRKLLASLPRPTAESARRTHERLHVDLSRWYSPLEIPQYLQEVARAVWDRRRLKIEYESWDNRSIREVEPFGLVLKNSVWYVVARRREELRTYRVSGIRSLVALNATFEAPPAFDLREYWEASTQNFERRLARETATLRCSQKVLPLFDRLGTGPVQRVDDEEPCMVTIPIESIERAAREFLALGDAVEVLAPSALRERVASAARATAAVYEAKRVRKRARSTSKTPTR
ncbi:MAG TPA: WYL domain-containing protein [Candidatus Tumulicola sp.]